MCAPTNALSSSSWPLPSFPVPVGGTVTWLMITNTGRRGSPVRGSRARPPQDAAWAPWR
jgi:hypothetical protein